MTLLGAILLTLGLATAQAATAGEMVAQVIHSTALGRPWNISVYRPDGYLTSGMRYPVLYFLPGYRARREDFANLALHELADAAITAGRMPAGLIVVPELGASWGIDGQEQMQTALLADLVAAIERDWRVLPGRSGRAIGGISAGGFAAMRLALLHPDRFSAVAVLSPATYVPEPPEHSASRRSAVFIRPDGSAFDPETWRSFNYPALLPRFRAAGIAMPLFAASGDADHLGTHDQAERLRETWQHLGMPVELRLVPGGHTYAVWRMLMPDAMAFAFRFTDPPSP